MPRRIKTKSITPAVPPPKKCLNKKPPLTPPIPPRPRHRHLPPLRHPIKPIVEGLLKLPLRAPNDGLDEGPQLLAAAVLLGPGAQDAPTRRSTAAALLDVLDREGAARCDELVVIEGW